MCQIKNKYFLLLLLLTAFLGSCTKQLNQTPQSTAGGDAVFGSVQGLQLYAASFYDNLPGISDIYKTDAGLCDYGTQSGTPNFLLENAYTSRTSTGWTFTALRNINYFIANCNSPAVLESDKENFIGLARFFRAYFYYGMVQRFGDVPWISKPLDIGDSALYAQRSPRTLVMDSVLADLDYAIQHIQLQTDPTSSQITKWIAYGLKSRVCLFEGTFRKYLDTTYHLGSTSAQLLQYAADAAKAVIDSGGFKLNTTGGTTQSYRQVFISPSPIASEVMLADAANTGLAVFNDANWYFTSATYGVRFSFIRRFINTFLNIDGTPFTNTAGYETMPFAQETQGRDGRLQQTIRTPGYTRTSSGITLPAPPVFSYTYTGYQPIKWCLDDMQYDAGTLNTNSISLMRYAEILLNYAEARAELGQLTNADWAMTVGALRSRAGITGGLTAPPAVVDTYMHDNYFSDVTSPALMEIRRERGIELSLEGFRFYDLLRWGHGEQVSNTWNGMYVPALNQLMDLNGDGTPDVCFYQGAAPSGPVSGVTYVNVSPTLNGQPNPQILSNGTYGELHWLDNVPRDWESYKYLYPIPFSEIQLNPNLAQNTGWQ
jgi:hypothetical protein